MAKSPINVGGGGPVINDLPIGGTTGQVLAKETNDNYAVAWIDPPEGGTGAAKTGTGTITTTGWVANAGDYAYKLDLVVSGIVATDVLAVIIDKDSVDVATQIELCPSNDSYAGGITFYAKSIPVSTIDFSYAAIIGASSEIGTSNIWGGM